MAIKKVDYDNEKELDVWVQNNHKTFFGDVIYILGNFIIKTKRDKGSKPDGFILDLKNSTWAIVEVELLHHGVWDHIAEQIIRFIVASTNNESQKKVRDLFFNEIENRNLVKELSIKLNETESRIIQRIETIVSQPPDIVIFIDEINEDLEDMIEALKSTVKVFQIQKFLVNGNIEYLSKGGDEQPIIETTIEEVQDTQGRQLDALDLIGGGKYLDKMGSTKFYGLENGDVVSMKYSKRYETETPGYWFGLTPIVLEKYKKYNTNSIILILGEKGVIKLPMNILEEYLKTANTTNNNDGTTKHYHLFVREDPNIMLFTNKSKNNWNMTDYYFSYD